jgi:pimeloyl-ACP methyl ester carboxylesterase
MPKGRNGTSPFATIAATVVSAAAGLAAGWIAYSKFIVNHSIRVGPAIVTLRKEFRCKSRAVLSYYFDEVGEGPPLVLLHSINVAASSYEMRPIFQHYEKHRRIYALDLPGFAFSDRGDHPYTPALYVEAILEFLRNKVKEPADVIALSLSGEFAASAALQEPAAFHSLTLISPTGFALRAGDQTLPRASAHGTANMIYALISFPLWSQALYDLLVTRLIIRAFLSRSFMGPVDRGLEEYAYRTAHQPEARHAPLIFISGRLFTPYVRAAVYDKLTLPVLVLYDKDPYVRFDALPEFVVKHPTWQAVRITPTNGLPHFERMPAVARALDAFWGSISQGGLG